MEICTFSLLFFISLTFLTCAYGSDNFPQGRNLRKLVNESRPQNYRQKNSITKLQRNQVVFEQAQHERKVLINNPGNQGYPGQPDYTGYPGQPGYTGYPGQPGYTGYPGDQSYGGYRGYQVNQFQDQAGSSSDVGYFDNTQYSATPRLPVGVFRPQPSPRNRQVDRATLVQATNSLNQLRIREDQAPPQRKTISFNEGDELLYSDGRLRGVYVITGKNPKTGNPVGTFFRIRQGRITSPVDPEETNYVQRNGVNIFLRAAENKWHKLKTEPVLEAAPHPEPVPDPRRRYRIRQH